MSVAPGATQLTVTPSAAYSRDSSFAAAVTAARSTTEMARSGWGWRTAVEVTNTSRPKPRDAMPGSARRASRSGPSSSSSARGPPGVVGDVEDPAGRRAAGVEDQHVRRAVPGRHRVQRGRRRVRRGDVADQRADRGARPLLQPRRRRLERLGAPAGDDDAVRRREARGDRVADAGGAAADQAVRAVMVASQGSCACRLGLA